MFLLKKLFVPYARSLSLFIAPYVSPSTPLIRGRQEKVQRKWEARKGFFKDERKNIKVFPSKKKPSEDGEKNKKVSPFAPIVRGRHRRVLCRQIGFVFLKNTNMSYIVYTNIVFSVERVSEIC